jgi:hypothetical protein
LKRVRFFIIPAAAIALAAGIMATAAPALASPACSGSGCSDGLQATATITTSISLTLDQTAISYNGGAGGSLNQNPDVTATVTTNDPTGYFIQFSGPDSLVAADSNTLPLAGDTFIMDDVTSSWYGPLTSSDLSNGITFASASAPASGATSVFSTFINVPATQAPDTYLGTYNITAFAA